MHDANDASKSKMMKDDTLRWLLVATVFLAVGFAVHWYALHPTNISMESYLPGWALMSLSARANSLGRLASAIGEAGNGAL